MKPKGANTYTNKKILDRLTKHCLDEHLSKYTMNAPSYKAVGLRMKVDEELREQVEDILLQADAWWERKGVEALHDTTFNNFMYVRLTNSKAFTKDHAAIDLEDRITVLEESKR